jgi:hypothetical protein
MGKTLWQESRQQCVKATEDVGLAVTEDAARVQDLNINGAMTVQTK